MVAWRKKRGGGVVRVRGEKYFIREGVGGWV